MTPKREKLDPPALALLAEQAAQMHQDLVTLLSAGVVPSPAKGASGWVNDSYQSLLSRSMKAIGSDDAIVHLVKPSSRMKLSDLCMALGQIEATLRVFLDEAVEGAKPPMGFTPPGRSETDDSN